MPSPTAKLEAAIRRLQSAQARLAEIEAEEARLAAEKAAILAEVESDRRVPGFPRPVALSTSDRMRLTLPDHYDHIDQMAQEQSEPAPRKLGRPLRTRGGGPITKAARALGISVLELSGQLGVTYAACRNWDRADRRIPDDIRPKLEKLLAARR